jgi:hypothetical protein
MGVKQMLSEKYMNKKMLMAGILSLSVGGLLMSTMFQSVDARFGDTRMSNMMNSTYAQVEEVSDEVLEDLEKMFTVLINDEYKARAEYVALVDEFGAVSPFTNLINAETSHIKALTRLFDAYGLDVPADNGSQFAVVPDTLEEAYAIGVQAEIDNIDLYEGYLDADLPTNVERVFTNLMNASENHLATFTAYEDGKTSEDCTAIPQSKNTQNSINRQNNRNN